MSIPVELLSLAEVRTCYRFAYRLTGNAQVPSYPVAATPMLQSRALLIASVFRHSYTNPLARPKVDLACPPHSASDYSLIVDGQAAMVGETLRITPPRAVLHLPNAQPVAMHLRVRPHGISVAGRRQQVGQFIAPSSTTPSASPRHTKNARSCA